MSGRDVMQRGTTAWLLAAALAASSAESPVRAADEPLTAARRDAGWVTYAVPITRGDQAPCCFKGWRGSEKLERGCTLDGGRSRGGLFGTIDSPKMKPNATALQVFLRFDGGRVDRVLAVGDDCPVTAGALKVRVLDGVEPAASAAVLAETAQDPKRDLSDQALSALALHQRVGVDALLAVARDGKRPPSQRRQALFWLGESDDPRALTEIEAILTR